MASSDGQRAQVAGRDSIEFSAPTPISHQQQQTLEKPHSTSTSGADAGFMDEKNPSLPVQDYAVDPERQSTRVGSLAARSDSEEERGPVRKLWDQHWKKLCQIIVFKLFTASVSPFRHPPGVSLSRAELMAMAAAGGGFTASSSSAIPTARAG